MSAYTYQLLLKISLGLEVKSLDFNGNSLDVIIFLILMTKSALINRLNFEILDLGKSIDIQGISWILNKGRICVIKDFEMDK